MENDAMFEVVAIVTSAGGLPALTAVLPAIGPDNPVPVVVAQHLGEHGSLLVEILRRSTHLSSIEWAVDGSSLRPGGMFVCPPRMMLELQPDETVRLTPLPSGHTGRPFDVLLGSMAASYGTRGLAVVLTGMGSDACEGAQEVHANGGTVIVQSMASAAYPGMPEAAIATGALDLVLPLEEIGAVVHDLIHGGRLPVPQ
jgi:two-component system chemotaxis response regulator CheB